MWFLITLLMTCSLHEVAESTRQKYWPWMKNEIKPHGAQCLAVGSNGNEYRGTISVTSKGHRCLYWDRFQNIDRTAVSQGLGSHNYCRNPDNRSGPWCWVRGLRRTVRSFCDIPLCKKETKTPVHDTEMTCGERNTEDVKKFKIIGGSRAPIESQPWLAAIFKGNLFACGGTLIAPCWVLSAAHCFPPGRGAQKEQYTVYLGMDATNETNPKKEQTFKVAKLLLHQGFNAEDEDFNNDIALLQIVNSNGHCAERTPSVRTACLPPAHHMIPYGAFCHIAGYGREKNYGVPGNYSYSHYMKETKVQVLPQSVCEREDYYGKRVTENQFCAASPKWTEDACQGDSGGPLLCEANGRMFLFGVISWGEECAKKFKPGVYTKVTNYNNWIAKHTGLHSFTKGVMYPRKD
ncbi:plasminogen activator, urokinase a [Clarias gariepinus]